MYNGYIKPVETPEVKAAQLEQDYRHYVACPNCDCQACLRVEANEVAEIADWLDEHGTQEAALDRDGMTGISQEVIF